jgi:hypothetical protein
MAGANEFVIPRGRVRRSARWCRIRSYPDSAACDITALDAISRAQADKPWLPSPPPAATIPIRAAA